jgi:hypothetical protein
LKEASLISKKEKISLSKVLIDRKKYFSLKQLEEKELILKEKLQKISDSMFFSNHVIWMMYKNKAYQKTPQAISTWLNLKNHCSPKGYICTKRFNFLRDYIKEKYSIDISDKKHFPNETMLEEIYNGKIALDLIKDKLFIEKWQFYEYFKKDDKIAKWENYQSLN